MNGTRNFTLENLVMLSTFLLKPLRVGTMCSSSQTFAKQLVSWIEWEQARSIIEYGPGTGAFTKEILPCLRKDSRFFAVELDRRLYKSFIKSYPEVKVYNENAVEVEELCQKEGLDKVDAIISGLPWTCFSEQKQDALLEATLKVLKPRGQFATIAFTTGKFLPSGQKFARKLEKYFSEVSRSPTTWRNVPPAFFYRCRR